MSGEQKTAESLLIEMSVCMNEMIRAYDSDNMAFRSLMDKAYKLSLDGYSKISALVKLESENAALKESLAELIKIADYYHDREVTYTDMPYKNWTAAIEHAKKLIAENREQSLQQPPQEQES